MSCPKLFYVLVLMTEEGWISFKKYLLQYTRKESQNYICCQLLYVHRRKLEKDNYHKTFHTNYLPDLSSKVYLNILSRLFNWYEEWLAIDTFKKGKYAKELALIKRYNQIGAYQLADKKALSLEKKIKQSPHLELEQHQVLNQLYHSQYYSNNPIKGAKGNSLFFDCINSFVQSISEYSFGYLFEIDNHKDLRKLDYGPSVKVLETLVSFCEPKELVAVMQKAYLMIKEKDLKSYELFKNELQNCPISKDSDLYLMLCIYLSKSAIKLWHNGQLNDPKAILNAYSMSFNAIEHNKHQKFLPINLFNGVSNMGVLLSYEETDRFINSWVGKVHTRHKDSALKYCHAINAFRHDRFADLPQLLIGLEFDQHVYHIISKVKLIIAHYKLGEEDILYTLVRNLKQQLRRNSPAIQKSVSQKIQNLLAVIVLLQKSKTRNNIKIDLVAFQPIFFRAWVLKELKG